MIGELAALKGLLERKRAIFLFPLKALVNDKYKYFNNIYGKFGYRTIRATGDLSDEVPLLIKGQYDICLMTYEKFTALILGNPHILEQAGTVVIDEVQMIADKSRGANLEFILTLLRVRRKQGIEPQVIALSAVIGDTNGLERWLDAGLLKRTERPIPLDEGVITADGNFHYVSSDDNTENTLIDFVRREPRNGGNQEYVIPLVRKLVSEGKQVIVFRELTGEARGAGKYLAENLGLPPAQLTLDALPIGDPSNMSEALRDSLTGGVAIHTSHLSPEERLLIEENFRSPNSEIRVISATTTLAMGINTPAESVVIVGLQHPGNPPQPYSVAEYKNMVGRAGRLGFAERGSSFLLALSYREETENWNQYVKGHPEELVSRFLNESTDPRSLIVKVLVSAKKIIGAVKQNPGLAASDIIDFLEGSFGAYQQQQRYDSWKWNHDDLIQSLANLESHGIITKSENDLYQLTELGWIAGHSGLEVESITRLVDALRPLNKEQITDPTLIAASQLTMEVENVLFPFNKKGVKKETQSWLHELQTQPISSHVINMMLRIGPDDYVRGLRLKKAAACLFWITDTPLSEIEFSLQRHGRKDGAAGQIRSTSSRTRDVIYIVGAVAEYLHKGLELTDRIERLFTRLELGVPSSILEIAKIAGSQLTRGDYQTLIHTSLHTVEAIEKATDETILKALNDSRNKLDILRNAVERARENTIDDITYSVIPPYEP